MYSLLMKPHLILKLTRPLDKPVKCWEDMRFDKSGALTSINPSLDRIFLKTYRRPFWLATNYKPKTTSWSKAEIKEGLNRVYRVILQQNTSIPDALIKEIRLVPGVEYIRVGNIAAAPVPRSELASASSLTQRYRENSILLEEAHWFSKGNPEIKIAVLDTGFETDHPELKESMLPGKDFVNIIRGAKQFIGDHLGFDDEPDDSVGHGTHVAGIIAAKGLGMPLGVAPRCKILPVKVLGALKREGKIVGAGLVDNINYGLKWAVDQGVDIINMSLGIKHKGGGLPHEEVIRYALNKGVTVVAASGNDGTFDKYYPGALPGVIAVGASDDRGQIAPFSTYGGHVSLIAPGVNIYSTHLNKGYAISSGTSQAAPFVSGAIALLKAYSLQFGKQLHDWQVKFLLKHTSDKISTQYKDIKAGFGRINVLDALKYLKYKINTKAL